MNLIPLPAFQDNYLWLLHDGRRALVVDPGDAQPVLDFLALNRLHLDAILVTHHHADHVGGVLRRGFHGKYIHAVYRRALNSVTLRFSGDVGLRLIA